MKLIWHGLAEILSHASTRRAIEVAGRQGPLQERINIVGSLMFGPSVGALGADDRTTAAWIAALAIQTRAAPDTWLVRPAASRMIHETDIHTIPSEPPLLLRGPGVVQAHRPETGDRLFGDIASLGWCEVEGRICLFGMGYTENLEATDWAAAGWSPQWTGEDLEAQLPTFHLNSPLVRDLGAYHEFAWSAARYLIVLGLLAQCENSPLRIELDKRTRHVRLVDRPHRPRSTERGPVAGARVAEEQEISGHLKRQRYGTGHALTKWIYIEEYQARRWHARRWVVSHAADAPGRKP